MVVEGELKKSHMECSLFLNFDTVDILSQTALRVYGGRPVHCSHVRQYPRVIPTRHQQHLEIVGTKNVKTLTNVP